MDKKSDFVYFIGHYEIYRVCQMLHKPKKNSDIK